jgi:serine/threonine protein kinase
LTDFGVLELDFPEAIAKDLPPAAIDFIDKLLQLDPAKRLGANGVHEIKSHPFFEGINWDTVLNEPMDDVFIPRPTDQRDTSYFWGSYRSTTFLSQPNTHTHTHTLSVENENSNLISVRSLD